MNEKTKVDTLKAAILKFNKGEITKEELKGIAKSVDRKVDIWDKATQRHPNYPAGREESRVGFTYDPKHPRGKFMDKIIKKAIWKTIEFVHRKLFHNYDNEIYTYDDERLNALQDFAYAYIDQHGSHSPPRSKLYKQGVDIVLAFMKEDLRYRSLLFHMYNEMRAVFKKIELTEGEKDNIKRWK